MTLTIWDVPGHQRVIPTLRPNTLGASTDISFNPDGTMLAVATLGPYLWDVRDLQHPVDRTTSIDGRLATTIAFTPDGRHLIGTSVGGLVNVWDLSTGKIVNRFDSQQGALQDLALSPDGRVLATAGDSRTITLWDMATVGDGAALHPLAVLTGHTAPIQVLAFSRDGHTLASAGDDHMVMVWDVAAPRLLGALTGHTERIRGLAFTPDGTLISGAEDGRIIAWTLDSRAAVDRICARVGRSLTPREWSIYLPSQPYEQTCPGRI
jgi:WD40 repeat protein